MWFSFDLQRGSGGFYLIPNTALCGFLSTTYYRALWFCHIPITALFWFVALLKNG
jgi:hypothetical protein